jgi:hypothetical protein
MTDRLFSVEMRLFLLSKKRGLALLNGLRENLKTLDKDTGNGERT